MALIGLRLTARIISTIDASLEHVIPFPRMSIYISMPKDLCQIQLADVTWTCGLCWIHRSAPRNQVTCVLPCHISINMDQYEIIMHRGWCQHDYVHDLVDFLICSCQINGSHWFEIDDLDYIGPLDSMCNTSLGCPQSDDTSSCQWIFVKDRRPIFNSRSTT
jgi:hypothetical protein